MTCSSPSRSDSCARHALGHAARVDEHQRGAVRLDQLGEPVVDLLPDLGRHHRFERRGRHFEREIAGADWPVSMIVHSGAAVPGRPRPESAPPSRSASASPTGRCAAGSSPHSAVEPLQRQREMRAALVRRDRVDFVDDHGARGRQHARGRIPSRAGCRAIPASSRGCAAARRRIRSRSAGGRVAGAHPGADLDIGQALRPQGCADAGQRRLEIALDVVRQRLQRRDVDDLRLVRQAASGALAAPARRSPRGRRPASCPSRSARRSACAGRPGSPARPAPAPGSARRSCGRTRRRRRGERALTGSCGRYNGRKRRPSGQWVRMAEQFAKAAERAAGPQHSSALS